MHRTVLVLVICALAVSVAGCDKCGDYFWIDGATPHSCKDAPAVK